MTAVSADLHADMLSSAAVGLGLDIGSTPRIGLVRAALALFHDMPRAEAKNYAQASRKSRIIADGKDFVAGEVPDELADVGDTERAYAIRVGLAMAAGLPRSKAESYANMHKGRPRKTAAA